MTIEESLKTATKLLADTCPKPRFEAELLLSYTLGCERIALHLHPTREVVEFQKYMELVGRRAKHEPYEYITGKAGFYDIELSVKSGVLIPRPETEHLVEKVAQIIEANNITTMVEIGVGSGAISIVLARMFPHLVIEAGDISHEALAIAQQNIDHFGLQDRITLTHSDLFASLTLTPQIVVSNPPYIADDFELEPNVCEYEPHSALFGGHIGDELLIQIIHQTHQKKIPFLACEMGYDQKPSITQYLDQLGVKHYEFYQDLAGFDRGFVVKMEDY